MSENKFQVRSSGFTIVELLVGIAILGIITAIALPNFSSFLVKTRVDNQISELHRLVSSARNAAINSGQNVTLCPLSTANKCGSSWQNQLSIFTNSDNTSANNSVFDSNTESILKVKDKADDGDTLKFDQTIIVFSPSGRLVSGSNSKFSYCPKGYANFSRAVSISLTGRVSTSADIDGSGKEKDRKGNTITCS